jgi:predicted amidohydrolase
MAVFSGRRVIAVLVVLLLSLPAIVRPQSHVVVFTHANVIDGSGAEMARDMTVTIAGGRISDLQPSGKSAPSSSARVIDATNKFLIPGLWDMHVHWYDGRLPVLCERRRRCAPPQGERLSSWDGTTSGR